MKRIAVILFCWLACFARADETIPPAPAGYFNDYAHVVSAATTLRLNEQLADFERQSGNQILVAIYPKMQSDSEIADYTTRVFRSWKVGQREKNNGAALFVFVQDHKYFLVTGYGLEGALPDALCKTIMEQDAVPRFKAGDYGGGLAAAINDIISAAKGEYKGTGQTQLETRRRKSGDTGRTLIIFIVIIFIVLRALFGSRRHGWVMGSSGWGGYGGGFLGGGGFGGGGGGGGGGGFSGFSGGGGSSGGGGAGGSW